MTRYADPRRCPDCAHEIEYGDLVCAACALPLRGVTAQRLFQTLASADDLLVALRASAANPVPAPATGPVAPTVAGASAAGSATETQGVGAPAPRGLSAASVPKILLGLGAACLLVAALVFLAVTWSVMGVGGRTATLVGFTAVSGSLAAWMARRDLRGAAEALSLVAMGLLTLDTFGAREAGWLGEVTTPWFLVVLGALLASVGTTAAIAARRTAAAALTGVEIVAGIGVGLAGYGIADAAQPSGSVALALAVLLTGGAAVLARRLVLLLATGLSAVAAALLWLILFVTALDAVSPPTLRAMWVDLDAWQLLACVALAGAAAVARDVPRPGRVAAAAVAYGVLTLTTVLPALDETATSAALAVLAALVVAGALAWSLPRPWGLSTLLTQAVAGLAAVAAVAAVCARALTRLLEAAAAQWAGTTGGHLVGSPPAELPAPWLAPLLLVALLGTGLAVTRAVAVTQRAFVDPRVCVPLLALGLVATLASYPVPVWTVLAALLIVALGFLAWWWDRQSVVPLTLSAGFAAGAVVLGWYDEWLGLAALTVVLLMAGAVHLRVRHTDTGAVAGALVAAGVAGSVWTWGALLEASAPWVAATGLGLLAAMVLTLHLYPDEWWSCDAPVVARSGVEVGAAVSALPLGLAGVLLAPADTQATWAAVLLTVAGAAVTALSLLRADRRRLAWLGGTLLALASWVRLWDVGVREPEPYTLPTALVLLTLGVLHLRRSPEASTVTALGAGLGLALVPSLLWVLSDPGGLRALLLGTACLGLVAGGVRLGWTAPVAAGALVGSLELVRLAAPYVGDAVPRWVLIGTAGALLILMGVTWERRLQEARQVMGYVRGLR